MKKVLSIVFAILLIFSLFGCSNSKISNENMYIDDINTNGISINYRASGKYFYSKDNKKWTKTFLSGVNIGLTEGTTDLNNPDVSYDTYMQWFSDISAMNVNTIKVFTVMNPDFYKALYDFNSENKKQLNFFQGIWFNENYLYDIGDAFDNEDIISSSFIKAINETVDIVHGNSDYTTYGETSPAIYDNDVSKYLVGYILGLEWPADFVINTNTHNDKSSYSGTYLRTKEDSSPFEAFLCEMGDGLISFETKNYSYQTPVAFLNWSTTDVIDHTNEPFEEEDAVSVNTENIEGTSEYYSGLFAAIDIYPYYPEFLNYQEEYINYKDSNSKSNPYEAYLKDLSTYYDVPIVVAEFGLSTSRGVAHNSVMGYNQGGLTEEEQGQYITEMLDSIINSDYAGAMIFSWQDEWFKQTWNTVKYSSDDASCRTPNVQSAEQSYGILAVEAGESTACYVDGDSSEWDSNELISSTDYGDLYSKYDESYLYLMIKIKDSDSFDNNKLYIPVSTIGIGSKASNEFNLTFDKNTDFIIEINGKNETRVLTDSYYDVFSYKYGDNYEPIFNSGEYNKIYTFTSNEIELPSTNEIIEKKFYESGLLLFGITDPNNENYNSQSDFYYDNNILEMRIPWYILNVQNSTTANAINNFNNDGEITATTFDSIYISLTKENQNVILESINYKSKEKSSYHTRLKKSYSIIQDYMKKVY